MADGKVDIFLKIRLEMCFKVLKQYSWLLDSYVLDFFTEDHMQKLPKSWRYHLKKIPLEEFHYLMNLSQNGQKYVWPLSIICLRVLIQYLTLPRKPTEMKSNSVNLIESNKIDVAFIQSVSELSRQEFTCFKHPKLKNLFLKHVKPKKRYEIYKLAEITARIAHKLNVNYVVDVGSGLGHLSRIMAYGFNMHVCSIETQFQLTKQAEKLDSELENTASKYLEENVLKNIKSKRPVYMNQTITSDLSAADFLRKLKSAFSKDDNNFQFGIVGLHPCGDLASVLLKLYTECSEAKFINLVGCCYHKLTTASDTKTDKGFPLTDYCIKKCINISYEARALACHAIETYSNRLQMKKYDHLKVHCYRAALEKIIDKNWPNYRKSALGNVKSVPELNFKEYCKLALKKLDLSVPEEDLELNETQQNLSNWQDVVKYYSLRLMLAPLIETVILLDRKIYLIEKGINCRIYPAFDPEISPRNQLLLSKKIS